MTVLVRTGRKQTRITVDMVRSALEGVVADDPQRVDWRADLDQPARYLDNGQPSCLLARVLVKLGFSAGVLQELDREYPTGEIIHAGVPISASRHPALVKIDPIAMRLLQFVQDQQDVGRDWTAVVRAAFRRSPLRGIWERKRPWLSA